MNFDELQKSWRSQAVGGAAENVQLSAGLKSGWQKQQRKLLYTNIGVTLAFMATSAVMAWVYINFHEGHTLFFGGSILAIYVLMALYLFVMWRGIAYKKERLDSNSSEYLDYQIKKLLWQRKVHSTYSQYYAVILWLCLMLYGWDVTTGATIWFKLGFFLLTTGYIFGMLIYVNLTKRKRHIQKLDELVTGLEELKNGFVDKEIED